VSAFLIDRLAVVVVDSLVDSLVLCVDELLLAVFSAFVLELLELEALCWALFALSDSACCAALEEAEFVVAFAVLAEFEDELLFEAELLAAAD
jgi:hypothetical protein